MRNIGLMSAIAAALTTGRPMNFIYSGFDQGNPKPKATPKKAPSIDTSPVIDTTKESKRARRRRLAKEGRHNG